MIYHCFCFISQYLFFGNAIHSICRVSYFNPTWLSPQKFYPVHFPYILVGFVKLVLHSIHFLSCSDYYLYCLCCSFRLVHFVITLLCTIIASSLFLPPNQLSFHSSYLCYIPYSLENFKNSTQMLAIISYF